MDNILRKIEQYLIGTLLLAITFILFINVVLRIFGLSFEWAEEVARYGIVWVTFIGSSVCIYKGAHIGVDAITMILSQKGKKILSLIVYLIAIIFTVIFTHQSFLITMRVIETKQLSSTLELPMAYVYAAMPVGGVLMGIRYIQEIISSVKALREVEE
ncbi:C4-dicarboxylate transporter, DctQ subunit [Proteiniborus ethanoligenes]|uniref:C4-dicarboxylate transporter, DctQ subunit n=1 Tax=Proteiniborus ethanoligenes TaxID=415015 RepID=A0A1H3MLI7_9FIRM|nr:TRAP transporter small permease [Proteiniborus ethanoligenes]TAH63919.1 MAG: TRAP transporter small permease [Gottschalkiaceae bacterium]SDY77254.1 C4-dicarboxylate transporter, DctQ subunit [Proteiniborus ethanoligenes]